MKYISRITALLLVLVMLTPTFASALTLSTATQSDLDKLYQEAMASLDGVRFNGLIGQVAILPVQAEGTSNRQWYQIIENEDGTVTEHMLENATGEECQVVFQAETYAYYCRYTDNSDQEQCTVKYIIEPTRDLDEYLAELSWGFDFRCANTDVWNTHAIYQHLNTVWNVTLDGANLAESIVAYWWNDGNVLDTEVGLLCSCVVDGVVSDVDECMLNPASDRHAESCGWAKPVIMASADVSTPDKLLALEGKNLVLTTTVQNADNYSWQNYVFDEDMQNWIWQSFSSNETLALTVSKETIQTAYRLMLAYASDNEGSFVDTKPLYLGGYDFFNWILTNEDIQVWMADDSVTLADVVARYNNAADEEDRTNAEDYTYGEEGESVNLKVPQGTFAEDYVMEIAPATLSDATINAVLQSMDATGIAQMQVLTAFDIAFAALADRTRKLQPAEGTSVALTFEVDTTGIDEALKYLYVYHIANDGTPEVVAGPVEVTFGVQPIPVQAEGFSTYLAMATNDYCAYCSNHDFCVYSDISYTSVWAMYERLNDENEMNEQARKRYLEDYQKHIAAGEYPLLCTCEQGYTVEPSEDHSANCPWRDTVQYVTGPLGGDVNIIVGTSGTSYMWYKMEEGAYVEILGETDSWFTAVVTDEETYYRCAITNGEGAATASYKTYAVRMQTTVMADYLSLLENKLDKADYDLTEYAATAEYYINDLWNIVVGQDAEGNDVYLSMLVLEFWNQIKDEYYYDQILCSCVLNDPAAHPEHKYMLPWDENHDLDCPWYTGSPVVELRPEMDDEGNVVSYVLSFMNENYEEQIVAKSTLMRKEENSNEYHYFQDVNTGWYVAYLHEVTNEDGTVTQWIIPLPSEKDLEETPAT